jgi:hypothetical protein
MTLSEQQTEQHAGQHGAEFGAESGEQDAPEKFRRDLQERVGGRNVKDVVESTCQPCGELPRCMP